MSIPVMIIGMALINLAIRWPVYLFANHFRFPPIIERALAFVPVAVLTAIIVPTVLYPGDGTKLDLTWHNPALLASLVAAAVTMWTCYRFKGTAGWLQTPMFLWLSFVAALTLTIARANK